MAAHTSMLHLRVEGDIKAQATLALNAMRLSMSDAVRLFLHHVVIDQAFPLELKVPNAETRRTLLSTLGFHQAVAEIWNAIQLFKLE